MTMKNVTTAFLLVAGLAGATCAAYAQPPDYPPPPPPDDSMQAPPDAPPDYQGDQGAAPDGAVSNDVFYNELSPYGEWVYREGYGQVWVPRVAVGWRPYTTGHWIYTDQGWAWVADEPWGWAAFHYGRWYDDGGVWAWVPGTVWAPAWVAWRSGGGYVGWAALPPTVGFSFGVGLDLGGVGVSFGLAPEHYCFVQENAILEPRIATVIVAPARNVTIINNTKNITNITVVNNRVVNRGVDVAQIEKATGRPVPRMQVAAMATASGGRSQVRGNQVSFYQPPAIARAARQNRAEFGKAGVPAAVQPKAAQNRPRTGGQPNPNYQRGSQPANGRPANGQPPSNPNPTGSRTYTQRNPSQPVESSANVQELQRRHAAEQSQLAAQQAAERKQLAQRHQTEKAQAQGSSNANELAQRHVAEQRALDQQHKQQQQELQVRHQREAQAAKPQPKPKPEERKPPGI